MNPDEFKAAQSRLDLTNQQFADALGVSLSTVVKLRGGQHDVPGPVVLAIEALEIRAGLRDA